MPQNNFARPINSFSYQTDDSGSALNRIKERLGIGRREQAIIITVVSVAVFTSILFLFRPKQLIPPPSAFSPIEKHVGMIEVTFTGNTDVPLQRVKLYSVEDYLDQDSLLRTFAQRLNLQPAEYSLTGNTYTNKEQDIALTTATGQQAMVYTTSQKLSPDMSVVQEQQARTKAGEFLETMGYIANELVLLEDRTQYLAINQEGAHEDINQVSPERATLIQLFYEKRLDTLPITFRSSSIEAISIEITANGVFRAVLPNTFFTLGDANEFRVISVEEAVENIRQGQFAIIGTTIRVQDENKFIRFDLNVQSLQYRFDETSKALFPVFRFSGTALTESYQKLPITVVTEAINVQDTANNDTVEPDLQNTAQPE